MQAMSSEIKLKVRFKKGPGFPHHGMESSSDKTDSSLMHGGARHRLGRNLRAQAGLDSQRNTFLPQGHKYIIPSCKVRHLTTLSPNLAGV